MRWARWQRRIGTRLAVAAVVVGVVGAVPAVSGADPIGPGDLGGGELSFPPTPVIDWSMPERWSESPSVGVPESGPIDPLSPEFQDYIRPPEGWSISVDGCESFGPSDTVVTAYSWSLRSPAGDTIGDLPRSSACTGGFDGLALGPYDLTLQVWDAGGITASLTERIEVKDLVIAVAGDSMASGEGNPEVPGDFQSGEISGWVNDDCDRSSRSGHAQAAREIEERDPHTSVTYINVACSGARTSELIDASWPGVIGDDRFHPPQLVHLAAALCDDDTSRAARATGPDGLLGVSGDIDANCSANDSRPVDSLFMTVGVNDIGFRDVLLECADINSTTLAQVGALIAGGAPGLFTAIVTEILKPDCQETELVQGLVSAGFDTIRGTAGTEGAFDRVDAEMTEAGLVSGGVYLAPYPHHVFTDSAFDGCGGAFTRLEDDEIAYLDTVNLRLNSLLREAANRVGWYPAPLFRSDEWLGHGYCEPEDERWFVSLTESVEQYNNVEVTTIEGTDEYPLTFGILHPDEQGHDQIRQFLVDEWVERSRPVTHEVTVQVQSLGVEDTLVYTRPESELPDTLLVDVGAFRVGLDGEEARWEEIDEVAIPLTWEEQGAGTNRWKMVPVTVGPASIVESGTCTEFSGQTLCPPWDGTFEFGVNEAETLTVQAVSSFIGVGAEVECPAPPDPGGGITPLALDTSLQAPTDPGGGGGTCVIGVNRGLRIDDRYGVGDGAGFGGGQSYQSSATDPYTGAGGITMRYSINSTPVAVPPVADAGGPYVVDEGSGGGVLTLDGTGSTDPDGDDSALAYAWNGLGVTPADSPTPTVDATDDLSGSVTLTVTDEAGLQASDTASVEVRNVAPSVVLDGATIDEGGTATLSGSFTDPGVADTHVATVEWADGDAGPAPLPLSADGSGGGTFTVSRTLGDDGSFDVTVGVTDDDGGTGTVTATVVVGNVDPGTSLTGESAELPGGTAVFTTPGVAAPLTVGASDAGSDDLTFAWSTGRTVTVYNDGNGPDPDPSPGPVFPFSASDSEQVAPATVGVHPVGVTVTDDDGGSAGDAIVILATATEERQYNERWWTRQFLRQRDLDAATLGGILDIVGYGSSVFAPEPGELAVATLEEAATVISGDAVVELRDELARALLLAWLHVASGAVGWADEVWTAAGLTSVGDVIAAAELVWADPEATDPVIGYTIGLLDSI